MTLSDTQVHKGRVHNYGKQQSCTVMADAIRVHKVTHQYTKGDLVTMANISYDGTVVADAVSTQRKSA